MNSSVYTIFAQKRVCITLAVEIRVHIIISFDTIPITKVDNTNSHPFPQPIPHTHTKTYINTFLPTILSSADSAHIPCEVTVSM